MDKELNDAIAKIVKEWDVFKTKEKLVYSKPEMEAVWCAMSDTAGSYEVDEEWIGVTKDGKIAWAYASGCSCWEGDYSEERYASMKEVILNHTQNTPEDWAKAIVTFAETGIMQSLQ